MTPAERKAAAEVMASDGPWDGRRRGTAAWGRSDDPCWNWDEFEFRVRPKPIVRYVNFYPEKNDNDRIHPTRKQADSAAMNSRIACVRNEFTEGQFDE